MYCNSNLQLFSLGGPMRRHPRLSIHRACMLCKDAVSICILTTLQLTLDASSMSSNACLGLSILHRHVMRGCCLREELLGSNVEVLGVVNVLAVTCILNVLDRKPASKERSL